MFKIKSKNHFKFLGITTSDFEIVELLKAWFAVSLAFGIVLRGSFDNLMYSFAVAAIAVGTGFLFHEMGHKISAIKRGHFAEFRSNTFMLVLAILFSFLGFVFAAPGAVVIYPKVDIYGRHNKISKKDNGFISMWGPLVNIILAIVFFGLIFILPGFWNTIAVYGMLINAWIGIFNLLPFGIFDGKKILVWNKIIYFSMVAVAIGLMILNYAF